ncbi:ArsR/SmtB family transcription factor [Streptacidiphilus jiangxiensis]|uniref:ArsR family transcriptional regulator n=1 Tax=Streptacidiphilus jiangxiensis TaxID=235985 RepID=A0A1H7WQD6_STRJI|nr:metalloregulator ArsR/SmtB family transcription factor [Streptacidiphilus jiangxiensis]SEM23651.1 ArsR family transcriptional regulator [Streptacidiphilus jiangxiensis]
MPPPLYQRKAEFFRLLGHPVRIRALELLSIGPTSVRALLDDIGAEPAYLSQQLAVLRRAGVVTSHREGALVVYRLTGPDVADLLRVARRILAELLAGQQRLLDELRADPEFEVDAVDAAGPDVDPDGDAQEVTPRADAACG